MYVYKPGFPGDSVGKESVYNARDETQRHEFNPWVGKIPWKRAWQPSPVFLPGASPWTEEPGELQSMGPIRGRHNGND